ncbi:flagellar basal-body rod protein FlgG [Aeromonas sp. RU39B]|jgi:flagellar basal-body rod protein FlgG|uniref:flagellar basal-body rod protein FlgG n=1 Tax=Aeromonas sp. RU39B TaxID=1907416 RepID=UPI00095735E4|nr:flagellar basal-body rod protein FlgG [Aeromonas sp. RU39B]SIR16812.1 flagellar basal-body rod protein FlgG [Aeromonas sp. RU39B]
MQTSLWVSKTGLAAMDAKLTTISNNLANVDTTGFKKDRIAFQDLFYQVQTQPGAQLDQQNQSPSGIQLGTGVRVVGTQKVFTTGDTSTTSNQLDLAIDGQGFFRVELPNGETAYTRDGAFQVNSESVIVNSAGLPLQPQMTVPENTTAITIATDGTVSATVSGESTAQTLGQITLANFVNAAGLEATGGNLYKATAASGDEVEGVAGEDSFGSIKQYALEGSNVSVVEEMVDMIATQRAYEMNAKVVSASDEMLQFVSQNM